MECRWNTPLEDDKGEPEEENRAVWGQGGPTEDPEAAVGSKRAEPADEEDLEDEVKQRLKQLRKA